MTTAKAKSTTTTNARRTKPRTAAKPRHVTIDNEELPTTSSAKSNHNPDLDALAVDQVAEVY